MRRLIYFFAIVLGIGAIILVWYLLRNRAPLISDDVVPGDVPLVGVLPIAPPSTIPTLSPTSSDEALPDAAPRFGIVANNPAKDFFIRETTLLIIQPDGQVIEINNNQAKVLSSTPITNLLEASFSADGSMVLAVFGRRTNQQASVFDIKQNLWKALPAGVRNPVWSPVSREVAYVTDDGKVKTVYLLDVEKSGAKPRQVASLHLPDVTLSWIGASQLLLAEPGNSKVRTSAFILDTRTKNMTSVAEDLPGAVVAWDATAGKGLVFSGDRTQNQTLEMVDAKGNPLGQFPFLTLPSKCAFDTLEESRPQPGAATSTPTVVKTPVLICAVPRQLDKVTLPEDYQMRQFFSNDDFFMLKLTDRMLLNVFGDGGVYVDVERPKVFDHRLFFINRFDQKVYGLAILS